MNVSSILLAIQSFNPIPHSFSTIFYQTLQFAFPSKPFPSLLQRNDLFSFFCSFSSLPLLSPLPSSALTSPLPFSHLGPRHLSLKSPTEPVRGALQVVQSAQGGPGAPQAVCQVTVGATQLGTFERHVLQGGGGDLVTWSTHWGGYEERSVELACGSLSCLPKLGLCLIQIDLLYLEPDTS